MPNLRFSVKMIISHNCLFSSKNKSHSYLELKFELFGVLSLACLIKIEIKCFVRNSSLRIEELK